MVAHRGNGSAADWFDVSTGKSPYRIEGKKTMGIELAWRWGGRFWTVMYPTGGGTGLIGMWKALMKWRRWWISSKRPKRSRHSLPGVRPSSGL